MKKILVTGAEGFIGSHLTEALVEAGYDVKAFIQYNSFNSKGWLRDFKPPKNYEVFFGDIRDPNGVRTAIAGCDCVMNLAALIAIPFSYHSPDSYIDTNVKGTLNILNAARDLGVERILQTSTSEVYGTAQFVPITEEHPLQGQSPYSASKIASDQLAYSYYSSFDLPITIVRPFNTYGPRQSQRAVIPTIITQIGAGKRIIQLGALTPTRDFNFIQDTVSGFVKIMQNPSTSGETINICSNFEVSIGDTAKIIAEQIGIDVEIKEDPSRLRPKNSEVERLYGCNKKILDLCGWSPQFGGLKGFKRGIASTCEWFLRPENLKYYSSNEYVI